MIGRKDIWKRKIYMRLRKRRNEAVALSSSNNKEDDVQRIEDRSSSNIEIIREDDNIGADMDVDDFRDGN